MTIHSSEYKIRRTRRIGGLILVFLASLTAIELLIQQLNKPVPVINNLLVFSLANLNIILLIVLIVVVVRNLAKLYLERKNNILGSKFQTKLIASFIVLTLIPSVLLFVIAGNLLTQSIEGWFNEQIEHSLREALEVAQTFYRNSINNSLYFAEQISEVLTDRRLLQEEDSLQHFLSEKQQEFNLGAIEIYTLGGDRLAYAINPNVPIGDFHIALSGILDVGQTGKARSLQDSLAEGDLIKSIVPIHSDPDSERTIGVLLVDYFVDGNLASKMKSIRRSFEQYKQIKIHKMPILGTYLLTFLLITLLVFFSAIWFGMHLAKGMTIPIQQLALGTESIAKGDLEYKVEVEANDEVGILVDSFNQMTSTLKTMTETLTERRRYIEMVLENIITGVVSLSPDGEITTFNRAASRILHIPQETVLHEHYRVFFEKPGMKRVISILRSTNERQGENYEEQIEVDIDGKTLSLLVSVTTMSDEQDRRIGTLIVFDDLTQLLNAQRIAAWREVARRLAHEIKNPLTPLQLSAQRLRRQAEKKSPRYDEIFEECTKTIIDEVDGLRHLVDEFSRFARMPAVNKTLVDLHKLLKKTVSSYAVYYTHIVFRTRLSQDISRIPADPRQLKQVFVNVIDNAIQAMGEHGEIVFQTCYDARRKVVIITIADSGPGIPEALKERLFIPYFSTKGSGRGLGLAIVHKIIGEHDGRIRLEDRHPHGTVFRIELPTLPFRKTTNVS
ncbi:PAS domain-containing sensor histidine kinase [candidate division KSB3 bacterium]|uniref:histidine kinase n=1 Tax=candidate division KSB3 bacterium TaxID=2044937 RepID=A0A2G6E9T9_9BACT|nr:MAG: PAS domain-containing sensor histidine kinase [candidate division KSB3 bacterium]